MIQIIRDPKGNIKKVGYISAEELTDKSIKKLLKDIKGIMK